MQPSSPRPSRPLSAAGWSWILAALFVLPLALLGRHLGDGLLSDDFVYAYWAKRSLRALVDHLTFASSQRILRPLPGLGWWLLVRLPAGALVLHGVSLLVHGANAALVAAICRRRGASPALAALLGLLFCVFPLFSEPTLWLSGSFDLWATFFALLAVAVVASEVASPAAILAGGLFVAALLCKESVFLLPAVLPLIVPAARRRAALLGLAGVAVVYLACRVLVFHGLGGYVSEGHEALPAFSPTTFAIQLFGKFPLRLLVPLKVWGVVAAVVGGGSALLGAAIACAFGLRALVRPALAAGAALVLAVLPVAPLFGIGWDQQGARYLYLPVALALLALAPRLPAPSRRALALGLLLAVGWAVALCLNGAAWTEAHRDVEGVLAALHATDSGWPPGATVFVDAHDTVGGAYVFRNGLREAAELRGQRGDRTWILGTSARFGGEAAGSLGTAVFDVGALTPGAYRDLTPCMRQAYRSLATTPAAEVPVVFSPFATNPVQWITPALPLRRPLAGAPGLLFVVRAEASCGTAGLLDAELFWRVDDGQPFVQERAESFVVNLAADLPVAVRLPASVAEGSTVQFKLYAHRGLVPSCHLDSRLVPLPAVCGATPP